jgi:hypothetical protein
VLVAAAGVATWRWLDREPAPAVPPTPTPAPVVAPPGAAAPAQADLGTKPKDPPKPAAAGPRLQFPDGSSMPALNGVKTDVVINWGTRPFTRVVGTEDGPRGWKWYVHENGTRSTTAMVDVNGVPQPMGLVADPEKALPPLPDLGTPPGTGNPKK